MCIYALQWHTTTRVNAGFSSYRRNLFATDLVLIQTYKLLSACIIISRPSTCCWTVYCSVFVLYSGNVVGCLFHVKCKNLPLRVNIFTHPIQWCQWEFLFVNNNHSKDALFVTVMCITHKYYISDNAFVDLLGVDSDVTTIEAVIYRPITPLLPA